MSKQPPLDLNVIAPLAPQLAEVCTLVASDIALVIGADGVIRNVSVRPSGMPIDPAGWVGRHFSDLVTDSNRTKVDLLIEEVLRDGLSRRREINHRSGTGSDIPVNYAAIRLGDTDTVLVAGRDLSAVSAIQQRFLERQQAMERDFWQLRNRESRYRTLFQVATDAVMVVSADEFRILEANAAGAELFEIPVESLQGSDVAVVFQRPFRAAVHELLITARASAQPAEIRVPLAHRRRHVALSATPYRSPDGLQLLVRARSLDAGIDSAGHQQMLDFVERMVDAVAVTDSALRVLMANRALVAMSGARDEQEIEGRTLPELLGVSREALAPVLETLRGSGIADQRLTIGGIRYRFTAALLEDADQEHLGFMVRRLGTPPGGVASGEMETLTRRLAGLGSELGVSDLRSLVHSFSTLVEGYLVRHALERCDQDAAKTAKLLGVDEAVVRTHLGSAPSPDQPDDS